MKELNTFRKFLNEGMNTFEITPEYLFDAAIKYIRMITMELLST